MTTGPANHPAPSARSGDVLSYDQVNELSDFPERIEVGLEDRVVHSQAAMKEHQGRCASEGHP